MDGWIIVDPGTAAALLAGRKTQARVPLASPLTHLRPGARIGVREACVPGRLRENGAEVTTALASATHACFPDGTRRARDGSTWRGSPPRDVEEQWLAAVHMPAWACRIALTVEWTRPERLNAITRADLAAEGWRGLLRKRTFIRHWNASHCMAGLRWEDDPQVAVIGFRVEG
jgi:hypothetical protein